MAPGTRGKAAAEAAAEAAASASPPPSVPPTSPLFKLPGELRNRIYRLTLKSRNVEVGSTGFERPALLNTCKEIRAEGLKIFYHENIFSVDMTSFQSDNLLKFESSILKMGIEIMKPNVYYLNAFNTPPNWTNFLTYAYRVHQRILVTRGLRTPNDLKKAEVKCAKRHAAGALFAIVTKLSNQPWEFVKETLEGQREMLVIQDERWADD